MTTKGFGQARNWIARRSARLLSFTHEMECRPGTQNKMVDYLSQLSLPSSDMSLEDDADVVSSLFAVTKKQFHLPGMSNSTEVWGHFSEEMAQ